MKINYFTASLSVLVRHEAQRLQRSLQDAPRVKQTSPYIHVGDILQLSKDTHTIRFQKHSIVWKSIYKIPSRAEMKELE